MILQAHEEIAVSEVDKIMYGMHVLCCAESVS